LITQVLSGLNKQYVDIYNVDTSIQRGDSFLIGSNIMDYSRMQLLVEVLVRFHRILSVREKSSLREFKRYVENTSSQYVYELKKEELPKEIKSLGNVYYRLLKKYKRKYKATEAYQVMKRVFEEHFNEKKKGGGVAKKKVTSSALMSPDDLEATFRYKAGNQSKGYVGHISETVNKDNTVNLITDVVVKQNNVGDEKILEERLPIMLERTPDLKEYHVDGAYASERVDKLAKANEVSIYQNNFRGRKSGSGIEIKVEEKIYKIKCKGGQEVQADVSLDNAGEVKKGVAKFDYEICKTCPYLEECKLKEVGGKRTRKQKAYYFGEKQILINQRRLRSENIPKEKRTLRANVEATIKEMKRGMKDGKVRIRQWRRISTHMILTAIAINFTRIAK